MSAKRNKSIAILGGKDAVYITEPQKVNLLQRLAHLELEQDTDTMCFYGYRRTSGSHGRRCVIRGLWDYDRSRWRVTWAIGELGLDFDQLIDR